MVSIEELYAWMKENTSLGESSVGKYSRAVNTISNEMSAKGVIPVGLLNMSLLQLDIYLPIILNDPDFIVKNTTGNNMYSNALKQYRMFRMDVPDIVADQNEIENAITGYEILKETERTAIIKSRIGQGVFRQRLMKKFEGSCLITGVSEKRILVASHIKPWAVSNNEERLSAEKGILLIPTYDKLFDYGLISFSNEENIIISSRLSSSDVSKLHLVSKEKYNLKITQEMKEHLDYHRDVIFVR